MSEGGNPRVDVIEKNISIDGNLEDRHWDVMELDNKTGSLDTKLFPTDLYQREGALSDLSKQKWEEYHFNHARRGIGVLIIYEKFKQHDNKENALHDLWNMKETFEILDFQVEVIIDAKSSALLQKLKDIRDSIQQNDTEEDCFACVISSHGAEVRKPSSDIREHVIYTYDGSVKTEDILELFNNRNCKSLRGKPKLFFIEACRVNFESEPSIHEIDHGVPAYITEIRYNGTEKDIPNVYEDTRTEAHGKYSPAQILANQSKAVSSVLEPIDFCSVPVFNDYLVVFSTPSGKIAWGDGDKGGWLSHCLFQVVKAMEKTLFRENLLDILIVAAGTMARDMETKNTEPTYEGTKAAAAIYHRLRKEIYLTPKTTRVLPSGYNMENID